MLKVVVFDSGWGGELVADFLMRELITVEVVRVIDWAHAPYCGKSVQKIQELTDLALQRYIGNVDLVVLGGYAVSLALDFLCAKYPEQKFVRMGINYDMILRSRNFPGQVVILSDRLTGASELRREMREALPYSTLIIPDCTGWEELINNDAMTTEILRQELGYDFVLEPIGKKTRKKVETETQFERLAEQVKMQETPVANEKRLALQTAIAKFAQAAEAAVQDEREVAQLMTKQNLAIKRRNDLRPDVVLLLNTHFWEIKLELEALFGWKVRVLDFREKLLHDVCIALKLRGVHGGRAK